MTATTTAPTSAQAAERAIDNAKTRPHIYSNKSSAHKVALWHKRSESAPSLLFTGQIDGQTAFVHLRQGPKGPFLSVNGLKNEDGTPNGIATANVFVGPAGIPKLLMKFKGEEKGVWVEFSPSLDVQVKVECGLSLQRQREVLEGIAQRRAGKAEASAPAKADKADKAEQADKSDKSDLAAAMASAASIATQQVNFDDLSSDIPF